MADGTLTPEHTASGHGRRLQMWRPPMSGPNSAGGLETVVARARDLIRKNSWAGAASEKSVTNGIGVGIQGKTVNGTPEQKAQIDRLWKRSCKQMDADGILGFEGMQALGWREWKEPGEVFIRIRSRRDSDGLAVPVQFQLIESEQCPRDYYSIASNGNPIREGIEFNRIGRRVAYWMYRAHPGDRHDMLTNATELVRVPAEQVIHLFRPVRAGQLRGIPDMVSVMVRLHNLDSLDDATLERVKIANLFAGWFTRKPGASDDGVLGETSTSRDTDDTPIAGLEPGTMAELPDGVEPVFSEPPSAGSDYAEFYRLNLMAAAARIGIPYEVLTGDLRNISDRALRLILNEFRRGIEMDQWLYMIPIFCQRIRDAWMDAAVVSGALNLPGYADDRDMYTETLWVPQGWPWSHPVQDVNAERNAVRAGFKSRTAVQLGSGEDPDQVNRQIAADNAFADQMAFVFDSDPRKVSASGITQARPAGSELPGDDTTTETTEE